jgi:hypothetical protein
MAKWFELSVIRELRSRVEAHFKGLLPSKEENETARAFWERVEKAGRLIEALDLFDKFAEEREKWVHMPRENKKIFAERIQREGRQAEVEEERKALLESGYSQREIHEILVDDFQPLDGSKTRPWTTPDPWEEGRLLHKKEEQDRLLATAYPEDYKDRLEKARWRLECAEMRREERLALRNARWRAQELKASAAARANKSDEPKVPESTAEVKSQETAWTSDEEPKINGKWVVVKDSSGSYVSQWVPEASLPG